MNINKKIITKTGLGAMICLGALLSFQSLMEKHEPASEVKISQTAKKTEPNIQREAIGIMGTVLGHILRNKEMSAGMQSVHFGSRETHVHKDGLFAVIYKADKRIVTKLDIDQKNINCSVFSTDDGYTGYIRKSGMGTVYFADTPKGTLTMVFKEGKPAVTNQKTGESVQWQEFAPYYDVIEKRNEEQSSFKFLTSYDDRTVAIGLEDEYNKYNSDEVNKKALAQEQADRERKEKESFSASMQAWKKQLQEQREQNMKRRFALAKKMGAWGYLILLAMQGISMLSRKRALKQHLPRAERDV